MDPLLARQPEAIEKMFSRIADRYDLLNHLLTLGLDLRWRRWAVQWLPKDARLVIDIGVGTGDFSVVAFQSRPDLHIVGVDLSKKMLSKALQKVTNLKGSFAVVQADALRLPFGDGVADGVLCAFTLRNFQNPERGLAEMARVLKPGGRALLLEFAPADTRWHRSVWGFFVRYAVPLFGGLLADPLAYQYLAASIKTMETPTEIAKALRAAGFGWAGFAPLAFGLVVFFLGIK
ncbi:MAG: ubiquinone/menaquinone biosynthesis methyltransferase [Armatimonadetes bacterium]|nr:ubiquinone/menaquinone biosynthesis methyltransferase [Armatimonadota bacterium]MDW8122171.1 ubiquinone/menaquinone biosynthesis methyltransferase [Armatimonadota bacterium]